MPTEAALNPVASATNPLKSIARSSPLPDFSAVAPSAANRPVPMIIAAVRNVAELLPRARCSAGPDRTPFRSGAIRQFLRLARPSCLPTRIPIHLVGHPKLSAQPLVIREAQRGEPLRDRPQSKPFRGDSFLPFDVGGADNVSQSLQRRIGQVEILENRLKGASGASMIQRHFRESRGIEWRRVFARRGRQQFTL